MRVYSRRASRVSQMPSCQICRLFCNTMLLFWSIWNHRPFWGYIGNSVSHIDLLPHKMYEQFTRITTYIHLPAGGKSAVVLHRASLYNFVIEINWHKTNSPPLLLWWLDIHHVIFLTKYSREWRSNNSWTSHANFQFWI